VNLEPSTLNLKTLNTTDAAKHFERQTKVSSSTANLAHDTLIPKPESLNPKPYTPNPTDAAKHFERQTKVSSSTANLADAYNGMGAAVEMTHARSAQHHLRTTTSQKCAAVPRRARI